MLITIRRIRQINLHQFQDYLGVNLSLSLHNLGLRSVFIFKPAQFRENKRKKYRAKEKEESERERE